jgi:GntR family transcriptional regulator
MDKVNDFFSDSPVPRYAQLADLFRHRIARGVWPSGTKLPSNEVLAREHNVARVTIRQAIEVLAREGLVEAQQGRGTFIIGASSSDRWLRVETTLTSLAEVYRDTEPELLNLVESMRDPPLEAADGSGAQSYFYMRRVHARQGRPYCIISIYLDERIFKKAPKAFRTQTVIPLLVKMRSPKIARARQTLTIGTADMETARYLGIAVNAPVAEVRRVFNSADGTVMYLGEVTYRGDFLRLEMDLKP